MDLDVNDYMAESGNKNLFSPKISVIVPVYKVEQYLPQCIESILNQTFTDFELLLINDGSPDRSGNICDEYAPKDARIRVFHKENGGVSSARNLGLDNAKGDWIAFVDSDDWVGELYLEQLYSRIVNIECSKGLVYQGHTRVDRTDTVVTEFEKKGAFVFQDSFSELFKSHRLYQWGGPIAKLYNLNLINDNKLRFDIKIHYTEDLLFMHQYLILCDWVLILEGSNYFYRIENVDSLTKKYYDFDSEYYIYQRHFDLLDAMILKFKLGEEDLEHCWRLYSSFVYRTFTSLYRPECIKTMNERIEKLHLLFDEKGKKKFCNKNKMMMIKIQSCLINHSQFRLCDLFTVIVFYLRYRFNKLWCFIR